jgi:endo-1,4-beta-xylanase
MSALPMVRYSANVTDTVSFEQSMNPYPNELPSRELEAWNKRMMEFMNLFVKHSRHISRVTFWGVTDGDSWKNDFPMRGRTDYPLLFDRNYEPKQFVKELLGE